MTTRGSNLICIRSRDLDNTDSVGNTGRLTLQTPIEALPNEKLFVCVHSAIFPNSWYNLSSDLNNNIISFKETSDSDYKNITISNGSYNITELMSAIKTGLQTNSTNTLTYTLTYNEITNSVNITHSNTGSITTQFDFSNEASQSSLRRFIGFSADVFTINSSNTSITSDRAVDITDSYNALYIRLPNLSNQKVIESSSGRYSNIVAQVPVPLSRNTIFTYMPPHPFCMELSQRTIGSIDINITFQNEALKVQFGRADWEVNLLVEYRLDNVRKYNDHTLMKSIINRMKHHEKKMIEDERHRRELKSILEQKK
tara:strand:+ start:187 stop:1125 length:939 start_codon:yes stop_codon:yes gene_type:complete